MNGANLFKCFMANKSFLLYIADVIRYFQQSIDACKHELIRCLRRGNGFCADRRIQSLGVYRLQG